MRRQGDIWFRESIRMENAVLWRVFHMNNVEITAKRIGIDPFIGFIVHRSKCCTHENDSIDVDSFIGFLYMKY